MARRSDDVQAVAAILNVVALGPLLLPQHLSHVLGDTGATVQARWHDATAALLRSALYPEATGRGVVRVPRKSGKKKRD